MNDVEASRDAAPDDASALMRRKGRTFWLASRLLPSNVVGDVAVLYAFCRTLDDAIDEAPSRDVGALRAARLASELEGREPRPAVAAFLAVAARRGIELRFARELLAGITSDTARVRITDDAALIRYAYLVAGTVGAMMRPLLGAQDERAASAAIDLGVAMQLTNICRDVAEDAAHDRVYLPADRLRAAGVEPEQLVRGLGARDRVAGVVRGLLDLADDRYRTAARGLSYMPLRPRLAIAVAARLYQEIGVRLGRLHGADPFRGRVVVPLWVKLGLGLGVITRELLRGIGRAMFVDRTGSSGANGGDHVLPSPALGARRGQA